MHRLFFFLLSTLLVAQAHATVLKVYPDGSGPYPGLHSALVAAQDGDSISLADGVFSGSLNRNLGIAGMDITFFSESIDATQCILDLEGQGRAFFIYNTPETHVKIVGLTIRGGDPSDQSLDLRSGDGGAVVIEGIGVGGMVQMEQCIFEENRAEAGGAVFIWQSQAEFQGCLFLDNLATDGAGIYAGFCNEGEGVYLKDSVFTGNDYPYADVGGYGSGAYFSHSRAIVENCTFADNRAWFGAGLLISTDSNVVVQNSLFAFAGQGEAVGVFSGEVEILACDIFGNAGGDWVGAIADQLGSPCNFSADPLFCDIETGNLNLNEISPCRDENNGGCGLVGALPLGCGSASAIELPSEQKPGPAGLRTCFPNPFNPATTIQFEVPPGNGIVRLEIFDTTGQRVAVLANGFLGAGIHEMVWRGVNDDGVAIASGVYFLRLSSSGQGETRKLLLLR